MNEQLQRAPQRMSGNVLETAITPSVSVGGSIWEDAQSMARAVRTAEYIAQAHVIPQQYQKNPGDCLVAIDIGQRMGISPFTVMQWSQMVYGNFTWRGAACKALVDGSGKFRNSRYEFCGKPGQMDWGCRLVAESARTNQTVAGPWVTMQLAKDEGWLDRKDKNGNKCSKWLTMPELMMRYRAASFFAKTECPERMMGYQTAEEIQDITPVTEQNEAQGVDYGAGDFADAALPAAPESAPELPEAATEPEPAQEEQVKLDEL